MTEEIKNVYVFHRAIVSVVEVKEKINWRKKDPSQPPSETNVEYDTKTAGWTIRCEDGSAIGLFPEDPGWKPGDVISMSMMLHQRKNQDA